MNLQSVMKTYAKATKGLQNYGANVRKNINQNSADFKAKAGTKGYNNYQTKNPFPNPFQADSYRLKEAMKPKK